MKGAYDVSIEAIEALEVLDSIYTVKDNTL